MKTKAAYVRAPWQTEIREVDIADTPPNGWIRLRVDACGVCGTDITAAAETAREWQPFGHELAGTVDALGPGVTNVRKGDRIVLQSSGYCGVCSLCRDGRVDLCNKAPHFWGEPAMGFSEYMMTPATLAVPYDGLSPEAASLAEPAGVAFDMVKTADIQMGDRVCVVGPGPIGLAGVALAVHRGAARVVCVGHAHSKARFALAETLGAEPIAVDGPIDEAPGLGEAFDHVLMTAPTQSIAPGLALLAYGGEMTYIGIGTGASMIQFDANDFHFRKLQLRASFASPAVYFPAVLRLLQAGVIPGERLISHRFGLDEIGSALAALRDDKTAALKVVVKPGRGA